MKDFKNKLALTIVCVVLGIILSIQFKTVKKTVGEGEYIPTQRAEQLVVELNTIKNERDALLKELNVIESKLKQYEKGEADKNVYVENLYKDLEKYRILSGYESLEGPGITIELNDPEAEFSDGYSIILQNYDLLLNLISKLNAAGAEAISINGQRYTSYTEVELAGYHLVVNGTSMSTPIQITVIGNPENLENALRMKGGVVSEYEYIGVLVKISQDENILIPKYNKIREFRYAAPLDSITN